MPLFFSAMPDQLVSGLAIRSLVGRIAYFSDKPYLRINLS